MSNKLSTFLKKFSFVFVFLFVFSFISSTSVYAIDEVVDDTQVQTVVIEATTDVVAPTEEPQQSAVEEATTPVLEIVVPVLEPVTEIASPVSEQVTNQGASALDAALSTDKDDYHPGQTATIFGKFFKSLTSFVLKIFGSDDNNENYTETTQTVTTDESGAFSYDFKLDDLYRPFYEMTASSLEGTTLASGWFRDGAIAVYDQCSNDDGDGYANGNTGCRFVNGNLQANNSVYHEGDSTLQRLSIEGLAPGSTHTVTVKYGTTKQGKHAYDFLTTWDASEGWSDINDRCEGVQTGCTTASEDTLPIPSDTNGSGHFESDFANRNFVMRGADMTSATAPLLSGSYSGDSETVITINYTVGPSNGTMCETKSNVTSCAMVLWFGAHISEGSKWFTFNGTTGAGSISGSPYHVALADFDGDTSSFPKGGGRDNQMQAGAIVVTPPQSTISGVKWNDADSNNAINNGELPLAGWTIFIDANTNGTLDGSETSTITDASGIYSFANLANATYIICEVMQVGWEQTYPTVTNTPTCHTVIINGTDISGINFGNRELKATLTLQKVVVTDNGGTAVDTAWTLSASGPTNISGTEGQPSITSALVNIGTYTLSEINGPAGYSPSAWVCPGKTVTSGQITLAGGDNITCTITNDDNAPALTLVKVVDNDNGGTATPANFTLTATGPTGFSGAGPSVSNGASFDAGVYALSESSLAGYTAGTWSCVGGTLNGASVTLGLGESATCTIHNTDNAPKLTLVKQVIKDNGGTANSGDWTLTATEYDTQSPDAGTYNLSESGGPAGYAQTSLTCSDSGSAQVTSVTLSLGENVTCTFVNDDIAPSLILNKIVDNGNGGTKLESNWTLTANGGVAGILAGPGSAGPTDVVSGSTFKVGTYALSESGDQTGYTASAWSCVKNGDLAVEGTSIILGLGDTGVCTITNNDIQPKLKLVKTMNNLYGGTATAADFQASINNNNVDWGTYVGLNAGSYDANETGLYGYTAGAWGGNCVADGSITLAVGDDKTCTITNSDVQPKLTVIKHVINNNGGSSLAPAFTMNVTAVSPSSSSFAGSETGTTITLNAGAYSVDESVFAGYAKTLGANCSGAISVGDEKTCTITNDDIAPKLTLNKIVINDNGGDMPASHWTLTANGGQAGTLTGAGVDNSSADVVSGGTFQVGTYALSESGEQAGYIASEWSCAKNGSAPVNGASVTLGIGDEATCTIINNDTPGHFTGGGSFFPGVLSFQSGGGKTQKDNRVTHGFTLHCDASRNPNRLEVNWGPVKNTQKFHLLTLNSAECKDNPNIDPQQPNADFDTIIGKGTGRYNGVDGATIEFTFDDAGEPGKNDRVWMMIKDKDGNKVLDTGSLGTVGLKLDIGNQQAHQDN